MEKDSKIYIAGHTGLVGSALYRKLKSDGYTNIITRTHTELDLTNQAAVNLFFQKEAPEYVFMAAAKVGGVYINNLQPASFMYQNMAMGINVIDAAYRYGVKKLLYMGSNCIYPKMAQQPIKEEALLTGALEKTNEGYALAKIAGVKMCEYYNREYGTDFISCMPCNAYGPGDSYDLKGSHVIAAMIRKFYTAKQEHSDSVVLWGTGTPLREFIYIDDVADAAVFLMNHYSGNETVNIGTGTEYAIRELAEKIRDAVGYNGTVSYDKSKPDGMKRKLLNAEKIFALGWMPKVSFERGIAYTVQDFKERYEKAEFEG